MRRLRYLRHLRHSNAVHVAPRRADDAPWWAYMLAGATIAYLACAIHSVYMERVRIQQELFQEQSSHSLHAPGSHRGTFSEAAGRRLGSAVQGLLGDGTDPRQWAAVIGKPDPFPAGWQGDTSAKAAQIRTVHAPPPSAVEVSVYSSKYHGRRTASSARYDHRRGLTAATSRHGRRPALPFGSTWEVEYKGRRVVVTITDTGSYKPRRARYWLDLSGEAWRQLTGGAKPSRFVARMRRVK